MKKFILMMGVAAFMAGCLEESTTQASSVAVDEDLSFDSSSSKKSSKSSSSKQVKSSSSKMGKSSSSTNKIALQSSSSIKVIFTINSSSSVALPTIIPGSESSSSQQPIEISDNQPLSSMAVIIPDPGSSASETLAVTGLGSCKPTKSPIDKGVSVTWSFIPNVAGGKYSAMQFAAQADYKWNFGGLADDGSGVRATSGKVTYKNSGVANASVTVTMPDGASEVIDCSPLQVNGDPITGCQCTVSEAVIDYTLQPEAVWTVAGCTSASEITSYTWNGVEGSASFTKAFVASTESYAPTLKVANADNTIVDVACDAVKATDGPEFEITERGSYGAIALPAGKSKVHLNFPKGDYYSPDCTIWCNANLSGRNDYSITLIVDGVEETSEFYVRLNLPTTTCNDNVVDFELSTDAECYVQ